MFGSQSWKRQKGGERERERRGGGERKYEHPLPTQHVLAYSCLQPSRRTDKRAGHRQTATVPQPCQIGLSHCLILFPNGPLFFQNIKASQSILGASHFHISFHWRISNASVTLLRQQFLPRSPVQAYSVLSSSERAAP